MTMRERLEDALYNKAADEQTAFKAELRTKTPDEVMDNAYRLVMQEDILMIFDEPACLSDREIRALLKLEHVLESCYNDWLKNDLSHMEDLRATVSGYANSCAEYFKQQQKPKRKSEPER